MKSVKQHLSFIKENSYKLSELNDSQRNKILLDLANLLEINISTIIYNNSLDLAKMPKNDPKYDRLELNEARIKNLSHDLRKVSELESPLNKLLEIKELANGLKLEKKTVPLGVVAVIYEARPNVTIDVFSLCLKSGNVAVLKGGTDAWETNNYLVGLIQQVLLNNNLDSNLVYLMPPEREAVYELLNAVGLVDVCIPRGSQGLINFVRENAKIPVIETGAGIVHTYVDESANLEFASKIIENAKTRRVSVCNALDCLVIHENRLDDLFMLVKNLSDKNVVIYADKKSFDKLTNTYPKHLLYIANDDSFGCEFLDYKISIKTVSNINDAIKHIMKYTSGHSEAIIADDKAVITMFLNRVDAAAVYVNSSTAFTDGGEFGMGAEIGISTQKLHARGPMALPELTSYKWIIYGNGQIR
ncbi:MAG: glutamate-5-semialdehyde dehydrogenase [Burkholderiales bacterium]|nr:glutamate-5-semialdehyde dehydrogenase [Burkholderiales bacterium]